jgi:hypothetical protein
MTDEKQERTEKEPWSWTAHVSCVSSPVKVSEGQAEQVLAQMEHGIFVQLPDGSKHRIHCDFSDGGAQAVSGVLEDGLERELRDLRTKYGARGKEPTTAWIARLGSELLAAQEARRLLLEERSRVAEFLGGSLTEPPIPLAKRAVEELQQLRAQVVRMAESVLVPTEKDRPEAPPPAAGKDPQVQRGPALTDRGDRAVCPLDQNPEGGLCLGDRCPWYVQGSGGFGRRECAVAALGKAAQALGPLAREVLDLLREKLRKKG